MEQSLYKVRFRWYEAPAISRHKLVAQATVCAEDPDHAIRIAAAIVSQRRAYDHKKPYVGASTLRSGACGKTVYVRKGERWVRLELRRYKWRVA